MAETEAEVPEPPDEVSTDTEITEVAEAFADLEALSEVKDTASEVNQVKDAVPEAKQTTVEVINIAPQPQVKAAEKTSDVQGFTSKSHNLSSPQAPPSISTCFLHIRNIILQILYQKLPSRNPLSSPVTSQTTKTNSSAVPNAWSQSVVFTLNRLA